MTLPFARWNRERALCRNPPSSEADRTSGRSQPSVHDGSIHGYLVAIRDPASMNKMRENLAPGLTA